MTAIHSSGSHTMFIITHMHNWALQINILSNMTQLMLSPWILVTGLIGEWAACVSIPNATTVVCGSRVLLKVLVFSKFIYLAKQCLPPKGIPKKAGHLFVIEVRDGPEEVPCFGLRHGSSYSWVKSVQIRNLTRRVGTVSFRSKA